MLFFNSSLEFKEETVYDENANVTFKQLPESTQEKITEVDEEIRASEDLMDIIIGIHTSDEKELTNLNELGGNIQDYVRNCRRIWDRLWKYFGVEDYKKQCFPPEAKGLALTSAEQRFLGELFEDASFLDGRVKHLDNEEKEKIQKVATNLYQMIRQRIGITEAICEKFYEATKDKSYIREKRFDEIGRDIEDARKRALDESDDDSLNIREKELWTEGLIDDLVNVIEKWKRIYRFMDELKCMAGEEYQDIIKPELLLNDAIKKEEDVE